MQKRKADKMISQLLISEPPLQVLPTLANTVGFYESIVLQQVHYWLKLPFSRHLIQGNFWVSYTPELWERQFPFWDQNIIRRVLKSLVRREVLAFHQTRDSGKAKYYTINYQALGELIASSQSKMKVSGLSPSYDHASFDAINPDANRGGSL
jgi:hypothetical protein